VQVGSPQLPGYGGQAAPKPGYGMQPESVYEKPIGNGNGNGNGVPGMPPIGPFDPRGAVTVPDNFWGFVMLVVGMR